ncbi:MAG: PKD domain-containing protein [Candidatus Cloacimonetes bacterium]|nr:PKD domain-containing protein [Candidatus Cloacimonadota bacterium]
MKKITSILVVLLFLIVACDRFETSFKPEVLYPEAKISASVEFGRIPLKVNFIDESTNNSEIEEWKWYFGTGSDSLAYNSTDKPDSITFIYNETGEYWTKLIVRKGAFTSIDSIKISTYEPDGPVPDFTFSPITGQAPLLVQFQDNSQAGSQPILSWKWDFNSDNIIDSEEQNPAYTFTSAGTYQVTLTVIDSLFEVSAEKEINVIEGISAIEHNILVELFTATWCTYCPYAEQALYNIERDLGVRFAFIEYHCYDDLEVVGNTNLLSYYELQTLPVTAIQGNESVFDGANIETYQSDIEQIIMPLLDQETKVKFYNLIADRVGDELNCSVEIELVDETLSLESLILKYAVIEDHDTRHFNYIGESLHNVVKINGYEDISEIDEQMIKQFTVSGVQDLPEDLSLVVWVQTFPASYNPETARVHNVIKKSINRSDK